jgi:diacylglycerol kinase (ATP)
VRRVVLVVNPAARGGSRALAADAAALLRAGGVEVDMLETSDRAGAVEVTAGAASLPGTVAVLCAGGDGTVREVAEGMVRALQTWPDGGPARASAPLLMVLPGGTGNSVYTALYGDRPWQELVAAVARGTLQRMDVDLIRIAERDVAVLLGASTGFFRWSLDAAEQMSHLSGRERYMAAGLAAATALTPYRGRVEVDGAFLAGGGLALVAAGGAVHRSGTVAILPRSRLDDGLIDVCVLETPDAESFLPLMTRVLEGSHIGAPGVAYAQGRRVVLTAEDGPLPFEHDGERWTGDDRTITLVVVPAALPVALPVDG